MIDDITIAINVHDPVVRTVRQDNPATPDAFVIVFGAPERPYGQSVTLFVTNDQWNAIVAEVAAKRKTQSAEYIAERVQAYDGLVPSWAKDGEK